MCQGRKRVESSVLYENEKLLIKRANAGPFWVKFEAIAGMCQTARRYQSKGLQGILLKAF